MTASTDDLNHFMGLRFFESFRLGSYVEGGVVPTE
jgi:hypothetical protein